MDNGLLNRKNIINRFYNNFRSYKLKNSQSYLVVIGDIGHDNFIEYNLSTGQIAFNMTLDVTVKRREYDESYFRFDPSSHGMREFEQTVSSSLTVMSYNESGFEMVSTTSSNWIMMHPTASGEILYAKRDLSINRMPSTEEEHFQLMTISNLILDLDDFSKIQEMIDTMHNIGGVVKVNDNISVDLRFEEVIRGDARAV